MCSSFVGLEQIEVVDELKYLIKWSGLSYQFCTWETREEVCMYWHVCVHTPSTYVTRCLMLMLALIVVLSIVATAPSMRSVLGYGSAAFAVFFVCQRPCKTAPCGSRLRAPTLPPLRTSWWAGWGGASSFFFVNNSTTGKLNNMESTTRGASQGRVMYRGGGRDTQGPKKSTAPRQ